MKEFINTYVSKSTTGMKTKEDEDRKNVDISSSVRINRELIVYCRHLNDGRSKLAAKHQFMIGDRTFTRR